MKPKRTNRKKKKTHIKNDDSCKNMSDYTYSLYVYQIHCQIVCVIVRSIVENLNRLVGPNICFTIYRRYRVIQQRKHRHFRGENVFFSSQEISLI